MSKTVLAVDDYDDAREALKLLLEICGCTVLEASDGETAVRLAKEQLPQLIFMDLMMPVMDGFEATRQLRECADTKDIIIVILSAYCSEISWRNRALQSGANDWLTKPPDMDKLEKLLGTD